MRRATSTGATLVAFAIVASALVAMRPNAVAEPDAPHLKPNPYAKGSKGSKGSVDSKGSGSVDANSGGHTKPKATPYQRKPNPYGLKNPFDDDQIQSGTADGVDDPFGGTGSSGSQVTDHGSPITTSIDDPPGSGGGDGAGSGGANGAGSGGANGLGGVNGSGSMGSGSNGSGSMGLGGANGSGSNGAANGGANGSGSMGSGSTGSASTGSASTGAGSNGAGSGGSIGSGSNGAGSGGANGSGSGGGGGSASGSASGSGSGPTIIQLPTDVAAPEVNASAFPTAVRLGGRFTMIVTATFGAGVEVNLKEPFDLGPAFEVRKRVSEDRQRGDGKTTREWQIDVLAWELGDLRLAGITVTYTVNGAVGQVDTNGVRIRVDGVLGDQVDDPKALRDMQPPTGLIGDNWFWLLIGGGALWLVAIIGLYWYLEGRRRARYRLLTGGVFARPRKMDMTSEKALAALLAIEKAGTLTGDETRREGYAKMVDVIREYLGARYRVATLDLTSSELVRRLAKVAPEEERLLVDAWLDTCDLVKYGGFPATHEEAKAVLDDARALVVMTTQPRPAIVPLDKDGTPRQEAAA